MNINYEKEESTPKTSHLFQSEFWKVVLKDDESKVLKRKLEKLVDTRKDHNKMMYETFIAKMTYTPIKDKPFKFDELKFDETLKAMVTKWKTVVELREESKQQTIAEATKTALKVKPFGRTEIKPLKKRR